MNGAGSDLFELRRTNVTRRTSPIALALRLPPDGNADEPADRMRQGRNASTLDPHLFRFGASSLLNDVLMQIRKERTGRYQGPDYFTLD